MVLRLTEKVTPGEEYGCIATVTPAADDTINALHIGNDVFCVTALPIEYLSMLAPVFYLVNLYITRSLLPNAYAMIGNVNSILEE